DHRVHVHVLGLGAGEVAAVLEAVPGAQPLQGLLALDVRGALLQLQTGAVALVVAGVDVGVHAHRDAADRVRHGHHPGEVDHDEVVDVDAGELLPGGHGAARTAVPEALVGHHAAVARRVDRAVVGVGGLGDLHQGAARHADDRHGAAVG